MSSLAVANKHLQRKVDAADANSGEVKVRVCAVLTVAYQGDYHKNLCAFTQNKCNLNQCELWSTASVMFKVKCNSSLLLLVLTCLLLD